MSKPVSQHRFVKALFVCLFFIFFPLYAEPNPGPRIREIRGGWSVYRPAEGEPTIEEVRRLPDTYWTRQTTMQQFKTSHMGPLLWYRVALPEGYSGESILKIGYVDQTFRLFLEETQLYAFGSRSDYLSSFSRHFVQLPPDYAGKNLYFEVYSAIEMIGPGNGKIDLGSRADIISQIVRDDLDKAILGVLYCLTALFSLILFFIRKKESTFLSFTVLVFCLGVYTFTRTDLKQVLFGNNYLMWGYLETASLFLLPLGIDLFVKNILKPSKKNPMYWLWVLSLGYAVPVLSISLFHPNILQIMLPFFKIAILANVLLCLVFCSLSAFRKNGEALIFIIGFTVAGLFGSYDLLQEMHLIGKTRFITPWGFFFLIGSFAIILGNRILHIYSDLQIYSREMERKNILVLETQQLMEGLYREIESTQKEVILRLSEVAEARSKETGNHVRRVTEYARILGECCGLSPKELDVLKLASPMHDIGKLGIPDAILLKPGSLTEEEFETMKSHTLVGFDMLRKSEREIFIAASIIAHEHHEKFDGSGYPRRLAGSDIHIFGRITAVADVFDSLASDRCYKKAWPLDEVLPHMMKEKNRHFDPAIIDVLFKNLDPILKIRDSFQDEYVVSS